MVCRVFADLHRSLFATSQVSVPREATTEQQQSERMQKHNGKKYSNSSYLLLLRRSKVLRSVGISQLMPTQHLNLDQAPAHHPPPRLQLLDVARDVRPSHALRFIVHCCRTTRKARSAICTEALYPFPDSVLLRSVGSSAQRSHLMLVLILVLPCCAVLSAPRRPCYR